MYEQIERWLNDTLKDGIPDEIVAFNFNLYEDFHPDRDKCWSMELVGTNSFNEDDEDWACDEVYDFGTRENPFSWTENTEWDIILDKIVQILNRYMMNGLYADILKQYDGIGVGFVDGNIEILYTKQQS